MLNIFLKPSLSAPLIPTYIVSLNFPTFRLIIPLKIRLVQNFNYFCVEKYALTDKVNNFSMTYKHFDSCQNMKVLVKYVMNTAPPPPCGGCRSIASSYYGVIGRHSSCLFRNDVFSYKPLTSKNERYEGRKKMLWTS